MEDMHIHLRDAIFNQNLFEEYIKKCIDSNLKKVVFLDHGNRISNKHKSVLSNKKTIDKFSNKISNFRKTELSKKIKLIKGIEIDYSEDLDFRTETFNILKYGQFEWIVGAIHSMKFENFGQYLETIIDMLNKYNINAIAHIKMSNDYYIYKKLIIKILEICHKNSVVIEINTSDRSRWSEEQLYYMLELMNEYKVDYVYSSDAHNVEDIGYKIKETMGKVEKWKKIK